MRRLILGLLLMLALWPAGVQAETKLMGSASLANGAAWTTSAVNWTDAEQTSIAVWFRNGAVTTGNVSIKLQGSMDATNWVDVGAANVVNTTAASAYYLAPYAIVLPAINDPAKSAPGVPALHLRLVVTNNSGATVTVLKAAFIHYQSR